jgi:pyruvate ferredoxin oxidoreductase delta subunit
MADKIRETLTAVSKPAPGEAGCTGDWRSSTPVINHEKCTQKDSCLYCWLYCPDAVISRDFPLEIDLEYCKGCGICAEECPMNAIEMVDGRSPDTKTTRNPE